MSDSPTPGPAEPGSAGAGEPARPRSYNLPRRYPVQVPAAHPDPVGPATGADVTRAHPTLAGPAAGDAASGHTEPSPGPPGYAPPPSGAPSGPTPPDYPPPQPMPAGSPPGPPRRNSRTLLLVGAAVVVVAAIVVGLVVGLSGGDSKHPDNSAATDRMAATKTASLVYGALNGHDAAKLRSLSCKNGSAPLAPLRSALAMIRGAHATSDETVSGDAATSTGTLSIAGQGGAAATTFDFRLLLHRAGSSWCFADLVRTATASTAPTSSVPTSVPVPTSTTAAGGTPASGLPPSPTAQSAALCQTLTGRPPLAQLIQVPTPAPNMPEEYLVPLAGTNTAVCTARFVAAQGHTAGAVAYVAEYAGLALSQYAAQLKTVGWQQLVGRSPVTYRDNLATTVSLVQQGGTLVMVVDRGR